MKMTLLIFLLLVGSCGKLRFFKSSEIKQDASKILASGRIEVKVFYEEGAEPYTDGIAQFKIWSVLEENLKALFPALGSQNILVPKDLSAMSKLSPQNKTTWTVQEVQALGQSLNRASSGTTSVFNIYFLKGHAAESNGIIGFHVSGTETIAIFKEVIESTNAGSDPLVPKYVEQATVIHEIGHAVGLVNNGLPLTSSHEDISHRPHCSNPNCVMYWSNEGAASLMSFIATRSNNLNLVMFDNACLQDVTSYKK